LRCVDLTVVDYESTAVARAGGFGKVRREDALAYARWSNVKDLPVKMSIKMRANKPPSYKPCPVRQWPANCAGRVRSTCPAVRRSSSTAHRLLQSLENH